MCAPVRPLLLEIHPYVGRICSQTKFLAFSDPFCNKHKNKSCFLQGVGGGLTLTASYNKESAK